MGFPLPSFHDAATRVFGRCVGIKRSPLRALLSVLVWEAPPVSWSVTLPPTSNAGLKAALTSAECARQRELHARRCVEVWRIRGPDDDCRDAAIVVTAGARARALADRARIRIQAFICCRGSAVEILRRDRPLLKQRWSPTDEGECRPDHFALAMEGRNRVERLSRNTWPATERLAKHPPRFRHPHKRALFA